MENDYLKMPLDDEMRIIDYGGGLTNPHVLDTDLQVQLGMITSMTITRGTGSVGWNIKDQPTGSDFPLIDDLVDGIDSLEGEDPDADTDSPVEDTSITFIIPFNFANLDYNASLLGSMLDCYAYGDQDFILQTIDSLVDNDYEEPLPDNDNIVEIEAKREGRYDELVTIVQTEYDNLRVAAHFDIGRYIIEGYSVMDATPLGQDTIIIIDMGY